jgi:Flp pilus assembly protein TadG
VKQWWRGDDRGQALVEFALLLPLLSFMMIGGSDLARAYATQLAVANGARAGAESAVIGYNLTDSQIIQHVRDEMARTPGMDPYSANATITVTHISGTPAYVKVQVQYTFRTIIAWPIVPNTALIDRYTQFRVFP